MIRILKYCFFLMSFLLLCGCAPKKKSEIIIQSEIKAANELNLDQDNISSPVIVRVYQLNEKVAFLTNNFFSLYNKPIATLGEDLIDFQEYQVRPGQTVQHKLVLWPNSNYIGVIAAYRDLEHSKWRFIIPIPYKKRDVIVPVSDKGDRQDLRIELGAQIVTASLLR